MIDLSPPWEDGEKASVPSAQLLVCFLSPTLLPPSSSCSLLFPVLLPTLVLITLGPPDNVREHPPPSQDP